MSGTKQFALRRLPSRKSTLRGWLPLGVTLSLALAAPVQAQRLPLPPAEQDAVNAAIDRGVGYLKRTQQKSGTWAKVGVKHRIGYAILPALTLLECGVPASDPLIRKAADYLRARAAGLDTTYDLALGILFLDRLGNPKDTRIIQTFALRLIAGQSATGGWGYKCPLLPPQNQRELLIALHHLDPRPPIGMPGIAGNPKGMPGIAGNPKGMPGIADNPKGMPAIAGGPGKEPAPIARTPDGRPLEGVAQQPGTPSLTGSTHRGSEKSTSPSGGLLGSGFGDSLSPAELVPTPPSRWRDCLGLGILERRKSEPLEADPEARADQKNAAKRPNDPDKPRPPRPDKPYVIPSRLRPLIVLQDPALHILADPRGKRNDLFLMTTDNSNTQFAILALWAAQRYDVPMNRTLNLIVRRYATSQNINGTWNYHYRFGGALKHEGFSSPGAMTCVGLIGLAVGHGMAQPVPAGQLVQDPRILRGLIALYAMVGRPTEQLMTVPQQNLYYLWSLERVAVLYRLPRIGDKDWYRWGAQILVTNQDRKGIWSGGGYPGSSATLDTCLALLFLKRANLAKDLTEKLPFKAADLNQGILERLMPSTPPPQSTPKPSESPKTIQESIASKEPLKQEAADKPIAKPSPSLPSTAPAGAATSEDAIPGTSAGKTKWIVISLLAFLLFAGGSVLVLFLARRGGEEEEKNGEPRKRKNKRKLQSAS